MYIEMAKPGPKPKPKMLALLDGNPSKRPLVPDELEVTCDMPVVKPAIVAMDELASLEFDRVIAAMPPGIYTAADVAVLTAYALSWSMLHKAQVELDNNGLVIERTLIDDDGAVKAVTVKPNPAIRAWQLAATTLMKAADELGLAPGVRSRMQIPNRQQARSKFDGLLKTSSSDD
jgi:P27 family predicted phage terminase small subunit